MIQYTTPTDELIVKGADLTGCEVWVSYQQGRRELDIEATDVSYDGHDTTITVELTQQQTASFKQGAVEIQVNWISPQDKRNATTIAKQEVLGNLLERVEHYGD